MAKWILETDDYIDEFEHHKCSNCDALALFDYKYTEDYDEGLDGEWFSLGVIVSGINEHISPYCPKCGSKMDCTEAIHRIYGCKMCEQFNESSPNYGYTDACNTCGDYPWASDELDSKWEINKKIKNEDSKSVEHLFEMMLAARKQINLRQAIYHENSTEKCLRGD